MENQYYVAVIGAGPAGLFGARELTSQGARVALFNRDIKAGGLAEYGIYLEKHTMKEGLRKQFRQTLAQPNIDYYGNISVGENGDFTLDDIRALGFDAVLITVGAQGTKWLGLPGEDLEGVYHAKDMVYGYNHLPPYSQRKFRFGKRAAIVGAGNVMIDIARYLINHQNVEEVTAIVRRGPAEVNFTKDEMKHLVAYLDLEAFDKEIERIRPMLEAVGQDAAAGKQKVLEALPKADPKTRNATFKFDFLSSPSAMLGENGLLTQIEVEENILVERNGKTSAKGAGVKRAFDAETVVFAIGDQVDANFGLPVEWGEFKKNDAPKFPIEDTSYESTVEGVFVGGWSRKASEGLVGYARRDGINAAKAVEAYLKTKSVGGLSPDAVAAKIKSLQKPIVYKEDIKRLEAAEAEEAKKRGLDEWKYDTNEEMLQAMGLLETA
ncbi:MAG: FAD-dependent oxidoreductase [Anaerolineales bacterium]|nr:FAD-dependent oxidoreductase [Anaerolineales bacterium]